MYKRECWRTVQIFTRIVVPFLGGLKERVMPYSEICVGLRHLEQGI